MTNDSRQLHSSEKEKELMIITTEDLSIQWSEETSENKEKHLPYRQAVEPIIRLGDWDARISSPSKDNFRIRGSLTKDWRP